MTEIIQKVWGEEEVIVNTVQYCSKLLYVRAGFACSEHLHLIKDEHFFVLSGSGVISLQGKLHAVKYGDGLRVPPRTYHRFATQEGMTLLETSTHHEDSDVERLSLSRRLDPVLDRRLIDALSSL